MKRIDFNQDWLFQKEGAAEWQPVNLPHDAMLHEERDRKSKGGSALGYFPGGKYLYEKAFTVPEEWKGKFVALEFNGIYRNSTIYVNGQKAGGRPYGYSRFFVEIDFLLQYGEENTILVTADNSALPNSRWYSGSGIYRPVYLWTANNVHIEPDGVKISTLAYQPARILVETAVTGGEVTVKILDHGKVIASGEGTSLELELENARLWSDEEPNLYQCHVTLTENRKTVDESTVSFGIRLVEWSTQGLLINGKNELLRGGCIHHDNGILGVCAYDQSEARRVRILKEAGYNAIRSAHNPISSAMLEACDRYGMYVMDETFDMWYMHKSKFDYAADFEEWHQQDIKSMVDKNFNHPSVIMVSIGNENTEPFEEKGIQFAQQMSDYLRSLDRNRAVTIGMNLMMISLAKKGVGIYKEDGGNPLHQDPEKEGKQKASGSFFFNLLMSLVGPVMKLLTNSKGTGKVTARGLSAVDIAGYNYASGRYFKDSKTYPDRVIVGSETFTHELAENWEMVKKYPHLIGDFVWTSWDYLGEASIGAWCYDGSGMSKPYPWLIAGTGAIDILGNPDISAKYAAAVWGLADKPAIGVRPLNHPGERVTTAMWRGTNAIESWAWKDCEGNKTLVEVYTDADQVELFINGHSLGKKKVKDFTAAFKVFYQSGTIKAIAYDENGVALSEQEMQSAFGDLKIELKSEEAQINPGDLVHVHVHLVGENGVVESNDDRKLTVTVEGGTLLGFGSANPCTEERFDAGSYTTYYGKALAIIQADDGETLSVKVTGEDLPLQEISLAVEM